MTLQNRVLPTGEIVADPARGTLTGNRGILHGADRKLGTARWRHRNWIACALKFKNRRRAPMAAGTWTELFFLDEAVAFAAGHRPCVECRRGAYTRFGDAWAVANSTRPNAAEMDRILHAARVRRDRSQIRHVARLEDLPTGAFILIDGAMFVVADDRICRFLPNGYSERQERFSGPVTVLTPAPIVDVMRAGYRPALHPSAFQIS